MKLSEELKIFYLKMNEVELSYPQLKIDDRCVFGYELENNVSRRLIITSNIKIAFFLTGKKTNPFLMYLYTFRIIIRLF